MYCGSPVTIFAIRYISDVVVPASGIITRSLLEIGGSGSSCGLVRSSTTVKK